MNTREIDKLIEALLYEGYILYPYRPSVKNRSRWTFGALAAGERPLHVECLVVGSAQSLIQVQSRFLHLVDRQVGWTGAATGDNFAPVAMLELEGVQYFPWQEAIERRIDLAPYSLGQLCAEPIAHPFSFPNVCDEQPLGRATELGIPLIVREQAAVSGVITIQAKSIGENAYQLTVEVANETPPVVPDRALEALVSTHAILHVDNGQFLSLTDPPSEFQTASSSLTNEGAWPVLVGDPEQQNQLLVSPIILYDFPQVAPESPGNLCDGTEIDEILSLRIRTLTDDERRQAIALDPRARDIIERTGALSNQQLGSLHGAIRGLERLPHSDKESSPCRS